MTSPKKESCLKGLAGVSGWPESLGESLDGAERVAPSPEELRLRDKALPDRLVIASLICDSVVIVYALVLSYWLRFQTSLSHLGVAQPRTLDEYAGYISFGALALILVLTTTGIYERGTLLRYRFVSLQVIKACAWWTAGFLSVVLVLRFEPPISRIYFLIASILTPATLLGWRWLLHRYLARSFVAVNLRQRVLFVGWNQESEEFGKHFVHDPAGAYEVVGCIGSMRARFQRKPTVRILGQFGDLVDVIQNKAIDIVILTDVNCVRGDIVGLANTCERLMVEFKIVPSYFQILVSGLHLETVSGIPILGVSRLPLDQLTNILLKRFVDICGAIVGLLLSAPILAIFGFLIYRESPGAIFFGQDRAGRRGIPFRMYKLRSMRLGSEKTDHLNQSTLREDPRVLKVGAFMRKWNIDEVPQFWNVLTGEMSLVGPRPERVFHSAKLGGEIPHYNARYNAKPGMTGWAQVKGFRGDTDLTERIKCDLFYLENWSPLLDLQVMFLTFFKRDNAY